MGYKILIVDDESSTRNVLKRYLESRAFAAITTHDGSEALLMAKESKPDIILADAEMPGLDGHTLCRILRKEETTRSIPVIMMSGAKIQEKDILSGLEGGADDYILKPFSLPILLAKIHVVLKRYETPSQMEDKLKKCGIELDPTGRTVKVKGKSVALTRKEFDLLATLIGKSGRVLRIAYLLETVWGYDPADYNDPGTVEVHISRLRKKLGPAVAKHIVSMTGHGYKFEE
ncbi:MAG: hypothetical protein A3G41_00065 [Elusimicrobia bacterium RIFCSPLOWO2_12_FULL_59_9]|nr:response regulator transcription factor [Elusimicrobiota bacterium]OGS01126.1 MAG: hypothetical protein A3G41_00065 [Elusimicrobia bacterium RIFCSPLOWO2_12_FULL_59_9]